jgi:hypothetical protein
MWLLSSILLFMACPTPPDKAQNNNNGPQNPPQGNAKVGDAGSQENIPQGSPDGSPKPSENPENAKQGDPNAKPMDVVADNQGDAAPPEGNENGEAIPTPEDQPDGVAAVQIQGEPPPENAEPTPVTGSLLIRVERIPSKGSKAKYTQDEVQENDYVTFTGNASCDDCEGALVLRAVRFLGPNDNHSENNLITQKTVEAGSFSIAVPEGSDPVALELLVDVNGDGQPSASEYFAVIEMAGQLIPDKDRKDLDMDSTRRDFFTPAPIPGTQGPQ